jgi:Glycosyl transferase family 2
VVRDVEDILEANLEFHLQQGVDFVVVTNHASTDGTAAILDRYVRDGRVMVIDEPGGPFQQASWVTHMARLAATDLRADWVINNHCDEFWCHDELTLKAFLETVPAEYGVVKAGRVNFLPVPDTSAPFHRRLAEDRAGAAACATPINANSWSDR